MRSVPGVPTAYPVGGNASGQVESLISEPYPVYPLRSLVVRMGVIYLGSEVEINSSRLESSPSSGYSGYASGKGASNQADGVTSEWVRTGYGGYGEREQRRREQPRPAGGLVMGLGRGAASGIATVLDVRATIHGREEVRG